MSCSLFQLAEAEDDRVFEMSDYQGPVARWCSGCGDHSVLTSVQRILADSQANPEHTVFVSTGVKLSRPDLDVWAVMGDGDCVSIGAGHWIHAVRYNVDMVALMLDNNIYGLTKKQTSPTTPQGYQSNTQPHGSYLPAMNPLEATLGVTNASFVAQTAEWLPAHLFATLKAAHEHRGFAWVRILQRCPHFTADIFGDAVKDPSRVELLVHDDGITVPALDRIIEHRLTHDPRDIHRARELAEDGEHLRLGLFYRDESRPRYEETRSLPHHTADEKKALMQEEFDRYAV